MIEPHAQPLAGTTGADVEPIELGTASGFIDRYFDVAARGSSLRQEAIAGVTTFLAMVYSVFVVPGMLGKA